MSLSNYRRNRLGGIDADRELVDGRIVPYTLNNNDIDELDLDKIKIKEYSPPPPSEQELKLSAFDFKGVTCSVCESDQNGWGVIGSRIETLLERGEEYRGIPFFMENGNHVILDTHQEWLDFVDAGWQARESILMKRIANV